MTLVVGVDENGLGPVLGPLVVTAAALELDGLYDPAGLAAVLADGPTVADSKRFVAFGRTATGERTALAYLAQLPGAGRVPDSADGVLTQLAPAPAAARRPCPAAAAPLCHGPDLALPHFGPAAGLDADVADLGQQLERGGVRLADVRVVALCPRDFNRRLPLVPGKLALDLALFEEVIEAVHTRLGAEALYLCGKIGGRKAYRGALGRLRRFPIRTREETRGRSAYDLPGLGRLEFVRDGDDLHPPTALASVIGKYVRELAMARLNRYFAARLEPCRPVSGYRDPVTKGLIEQSRELREAEGIPEDCFLRTR